MQKTIIFGLISLLLVFGLVGQKDNAAPEADLMNNIKHLSFTGIIQDIRDSAILVSEKNNDDNQIVFNLNQVLLIEDETQKFITKDEFQKGMVVTAYYPEHTPVALSLPPIMTPKVIVVNSSSTFMSTHVGQFNENLISDDGMLKIFISEETEIIDRNGDHVSKEEITNKTLVVFYTISTKSIPAQTTPHKIIVL